MQIVYLYYYKFRILHFYIPSYVVKVGRNYEYHDIQETTTYFSLFLFTIIA